MRLCLIFLCMAVLISCDSVKKPTENNEEYTTINIWLADNHISDVMDELVKLYNEEEGKKEGIRIEYKSFGDEYDVVHATVCATKNEPEIMSFPTNCTLSQLQKNEWITKIESLEGGAEFLKGRDEKRLLKGSGGTYAERLSYEIYKIVYNRDLFKKYGITDEAGQARPPGTWEEAAEIADVISEGGEDYGIVLPMRDSSFFWNSHLIKPFEPQLGSYYDEETGRYDFSIYEKAFSGFFTRLRRDKSYYPNPEWIDNDNARKLFADGRIGMKIATFYDMSAFNDLYSIGFDWGVAELPPFEASAEKPKAYAYETIGFAYITNAVNRLRDPSDAMKVFSWLMSEGVQSELYSNGKYLMSDEKVTAGKTPPDMKGWNEFSKYDEIIAFSQLQNGQQSEKEKFFDEIWLKEDDAEVSEMLSRMNYVWNGER